MHTTTTRVAGVLLALLTLTAAATALTPGAAAAARGMLAIPFTQPPATLHVAARILTSNLPLALLGVLGAALTPHLPRAVRGLLTTTLTLTLTANMLLIGAAAGAYGPRLLGWLTHLPLELAALALTTGHYHAAATTPTNRKTLALTAATATGLLAAGALLETYTPPIA